jgi:hypothetical protein
VGLEPTTSRIMGERASVWPRAWTVEEIVGGKLAVQGCKNRAGRRPQSASRRDPLRDARTC